MAELRFVVGTVACGKTLELVLTANQLQTINGTERIKILKPSIDTRFSQKVVRSAAGLHVKVTDLVSPIDDLLGLDFSATDCILVDEIQFFTVRQIEQLRRITVERGIQVVCFGLLKDFRCHLFESTKRLLELCDDIKTVKAFCMLCRENGFAQDGTSRPATCNMKIVKHDSDVKPNMQGDSICIGGIDTFLPVCYTCYHMKTQTLEEIQ